MFSTIRHLYCTDFTSGLNKSQLSKQRTFNSELFRQELFNKYNIDADFQRNKPGAFLLYECAEKLKFFSHILGNSFKQGHELSRSCPCFRTSYVRWKKSQKIVIFWIFPHLLLLIYNFQVVIKYRPCAASTVFYV